MRERLGFLLLFLAGLSCATTLSAGQGGPPPDNPTKQFAGLQSFTITREVNEINLIFTVTDEKGHLHTNLTQDDLQLLDNKKPPRRIEYFQRQSQLPLRIALLIDASSSILHRFNFEKKAAAMFLKKILRPSVDQAFVVAFDSKVQLVHDFTSDIKELEASFAHLRPGGNTALYDALVFATDKLRSRNDTFLTRRIIVLISDGMDTASRAIMYDAQQAPMRADTLLYALSTNQVIPSDYPKGEAALELLTRPTGGSVLPARDPNDLVRGFKRIENDLRSQYALGYTPLELEANGSFHTVQVLPKKGGLRVLCRRGYFATLK